MDFISRLIKPVYDTLRLLTLNLSRQRLRLETLIKEWVDIQKQAEIKDMQVRWVTRS